MNYTTILIPNSNLVSNPLVNMSHGNRSVRLRVIVGVDYNSDVSLVERLLIQTAKESFDTLLVHTKGLKQHPIHVCRKIKRLDPGVWFECNDGFFKSWNRKKGVYTYLF